ncbi:hypothetical protein V2J09_000559 [Rumex salicifolius]
MPIGVHISFAFFLLSSYALLLLRFAVVLASMYTIRIRALHSLMQHLFGTSSQSYKIYSWQKISDPRSIIEVLKQVYADHSTNFDGVFSKILETAEHPAASSALLL